MNFQEFYEKDEQRLSLVQKTINAFIDGNEVEFKNLATKVFKEKELIAEFSKQIGNEIPKMLMIDSNTFTILLDFYSQVPQIYKFNPLTYFSFILTNSVMNMKRFVGNIVDLFKHPFYNKQLVDNFMLMDSHHLLTLDMLKVFIDKAIQYNYLSKDNVEQLFTSMKGDISKDLFESIITYTATQYPQLLIKYTSLNYYIKKGV